MGIAQEHIAARNLSVGRPLRLRGASNAQAGRVAAFATHRAALWWRRLPRTLSRALACFLSRVHGTWRKTRRLGCVSACGMAAGGVNGGDAAAGGGAIGMAAGRPIEIKYGGTCGRACVADA